MATYYHNKLCQVMLLVVIKITIYCLYRTTKTIDLLYNYQFHCKFFIHFKNRMTRSDTVII